VISQGSNSWLSKVFSDIGLACDQGTNISMIDFGSSVFEIRRILERQELAVP
jgi:hypothetical protein